MKAKPMIHEQQLIDFANAVVDFLEFTAAEDWRRKRIEEDEWCRDDIGICLVCGSGASHSDDCPIKRLVGD